MEAVEKLYSPLFDSKQYPWWLFVQVLWSCFVVHKSNVRYPKDAITILLKFVVITVIVYVPRELFAYMVNLQSPVIGNPMSVLILIVVYTVIEAAPYDIAFRLLDRGLYSILGIAQGINQTRFWIRILQKRQKFVIINDNFDRILKIPTLILFLVSDQIIEIVARKLMKSELTKMSSIHTIFRTAALSLVFWISTQNNFLTPYIGIYSMKISALTMALILGIANATAILGSEYENTRLPPVQSKREETPISSPPPTPTRQSPTPYRRHITGNIL